MNFSWVRTRMPHRSSRIEKRQKGGSQSDSGLEASRVEIGIEKRAKKKTTASKPPEEEKEEDDEGEERAICRPSRFSEYTACSYGRQANHRQGVKLRRWRGFVL